MNSKGKQKLEELVRNKIIKDNNIIFFDEFTDYSKSDIEDLFTKDEYVNLFNSSFSDFDEIKASELENKPILNQINRKIDKIDLIIIYHLNISFLWITKKIFFLKIQRKDLNIFSKK